nr:MAG TPA: Major head protein [Caudoviricetes sp.]
MKKRLLMPMKLQFFSENPDGGNDTPPAGQPTPPDDKPKGEETGKTFSRDELAKIVAAETKKAVTAAEEKWRAEKDKAAKYAEMTAEERIQDELAEKDARIAEFERKEVLSKMSKQASKMLSGAGLPQDDELLGLIVSEDAEATKKAVAVITNFASQIKKENARQSTPGEGGQFSADKNTKQTVAELAAKNRIIK